MGRTIGAVVAGVVLWGLLWNVMNLGLAGAGVITPGEPITAVGVLVGLILYSAVLSLGAGWAAAAIKGAPDAMTAVRALAGTNLLIGIVTETDFLLVAHRALTLLGMLKSAESESTG